MSIIPFLLLSAAAASAQPMGASVVAGQAQVSSSGGTTTVNQSTAKAIINWQNFSVGAGAAVQFNQPSASAITLNRVTGSNVSTVDGAIRANGQVWLLNPNGLLFGGGATINVGGLLATTSDIANQDFIAGRYNFSGGLGGIVNNGTIKASGGGSVVLSAPSVTNNGLIVATAGHVVLGGTDTFTVDFNGDHLLSYAVSTSSQTGQVTNTGKISAAGGQILLTARAAAGVQAAVINNTGMIEASSVRSENGEIILDAGDGTATTSGTLDASGKAAGEIGGTVKVLGGVAAVSDNAVIDVSGNAGGGTVMVGGNFHGAGPEQNARNTSVGKAIIKADAIVSGNGGKVAVWSDGVTSFAGTIDARGGAASGNGGQVETSGHYLSVTSAANVSAAAPHGTPGDWLLDPDNINIATGGSDPDTGQTFSTTGSVNIAPSAIVASLNAGSPVTLQANQNITVSNFVNATSGQTLELDAGGSIAVNAVLEVAGGSIILSAGNPGGQPGGSLSGAAITQSPGASIVANSLSVLNGTAGGLITLTEPSNSFASLSVTTNGGAASITNSAGASIANPGVNTGGGDFTLSVAGPITQSWGIAANNLSITSTAGSVTLTDAGSCCTGPVDNGNVIAGTARFNTASNVSFTNADSSTSTTTIGSSTIGGNLTVLATETNLALADGSGTIAVSGLTTLTSNVGSITQTIPLTSSGLSASVGNGGIFLTNAANAVNSAATFQVPFDGGAGAAFTNSVATNLGASSIGAGAFAITSSAELNVTGAVTASGGLTLLASGNINQSSSGVITTPSLVAATQLASNSISLAAASNAISSATMFAGTNVSLFDTANLTLLRLNGSGVVTIQDNGNLTLANSVVGATVSAGFIAALHATGSIFGGTGTAVSAPSLSLVADSGSIGTTTGPLNIATNLLAASTSNNGGITLSAVPVSGTSLTLTTITSGANGNIGATNTTSLNAGTGNIQIAGNGAMSFSGNSIFGGTGTAVSASSLSLVADSGSIGTTTGPLNIATNLLAASTSNNSGITLSAVPVSGTSLTLTTITSGANGNIGATNTTGLNAGTGNIQIAGNGAMSFSGNSITAGNLRLAGFTTINASNVSIASLSAAASGAINISTLGGVQINNLTGGIGIQTPGAVTLNTLGTISSVSGIAGSLATGNLTASVNTGGGFGIFLGDGMNAVTGSVTLNAPGPIIFYNSVNTNIFSANYIPASTALPAISVDIEAFGASNPTLTIGAGITQNGTSITGNSVTLRGMGGILQSGTGQVSGSSVLLLSDVGSIGTATAPIQVQAGGSVLAGTVNQDIDLLFNLPQGVTNATVQLGLPTSTANFNAGTGNINISAASIDISGNTTITANSLNILSSSSVQLDNVLVGSFSAAASGGGSIDINSTSGFQLSNPNGGPAISTTGDASISVSSGSITQATGASGAIIAGTFSSFAVGGNNFNNPANAISSDIDIGSLANTTLVNSLSTHIDVASASGTLTIQSAGDLVLVAGPTIAGLSAASASAGTDFTGTGNNNGNNNNNGNGNGGININGTTVVTAATLSQLNGNLVSLNSSGDGIVLAAGGNFINNAGATALLLPNGARFLIYSADPAKDTFDGLKTANDGVFNVTYPAAVTATGNRYVFSVASSTDTDFLSGNSGLSAGTSTAAAPTLVGFVAALQPPPPPPPPVQSPLANNSSEQPVSSDQTTSQVANSLDGSTPQPAASAALSDLLVAIPPLPTPSAPPPPPVQSPLANNSSEQPVSSDQTTSQVANSLDGSTPRRGPRGSGGAVIPRMLVNARPPTPPPTDATALSSFGNSSLWQ